MENREGAIRKDFPCQAKGFLNGWKEGISVHNAGSQNEAFQSLSLQLTYIRVIQTRGQEDNLSRENRAGVTELKGGRIGNLQRIWKRRNTPGCWGSQE